MSADLNAALKFVKKNTQYALARKRTVYTPHAPKTVILEKCIVIQDGTLKQANLKKGYKKNYTDLFNAENATMTIMFACNEANHFYPLEDQKKAALKAKESDQVIEINLAMWVKRDSSYGAGPDQEHLYVGKVASVLQNSVEIELQMDGYRPSKRKRVDMQDLRSYFQKTEA